MSFVSVAIGAEEEVVLPLAELVSEQPTTESRTTAKRDERIRCFMGNYLARPMPMRK
jgi:hypothetical protein